MLKPQFGMQTFPGNLFFSARKGFIWLVISLLITFIFLSGSQLLENQNFNSYTSRESLIKSFPELATQLNSPEKLTFSTQIQDTNSQPYNGLKGQTSDSGDTLAAFYPENYQRPFVMEATGIKATLQPLGANPAQVTVDEGMAVYRGAYAKTDSLHLVTGGQSKEILLLHDRTAPPQFEYNLTIPSGTTARLDGDSVAIFDASGKGLRIMPPWLVDAKGQKHAEENVIRWEMREPPVLQADGAQSIKLVLALFPVNLAYPLAIDPTWSLTVSMQAQHYFQTATRLQDGRVLVVGGLQDSCGCATSLAEIYNPKTMTWARTLKPMGQPRYLHTATLLKNGEVLIAGAGYTPNPTTAEIYNPTNNSWRYTGNMHAPHIGGTAVLLQDGRVLISGGDDSIGHSDSTVEIYDPATGIWSLTSSPLVQDENHYASITLLSNGKVLWSGAVHTYVDNNGHHLGPADPEIYDPQTQVWTALPANGLHGGRGFLLNDGRVIFTSGEIYNPANNSVVQLPYQSNQGPTRLGNTLLSDGRLMITGSDSTVTSPVLIYDPYKNATYSAPSMSYARSSHTATLLNNGMVLVAGGLGTANSAELYNPSGVGNTSLSLSVSSSPGFIGSPVTITAAIAYSGGATGTITFKDGNNVLATVPVTNGGSASFTTSSLKQGAHNLGAVYSGDAYSRGSTAPNLALSIIPPNVTVNLVTNNNPTIYSEGGSLTAQFTTTDNSTVCEGTITLKESGIAIDSKEATCSNVYFSVPVNTTPLSVGTHNYTVEYSGGYGHSPATSNVAQVVVPKIETRATWTDFNYSSPPMTYTLGQEVHLTGKVVTYTGYDPRLYLPPFSGTVDITDTTGLIGTANVQNNGDFAINLTNLSVGSHSFFPKYNGDSNYTSNAYFAAKIDVIKAGSKIILNSQNNATVAGQTVTFTVQVRPDGPAQVTPGGSVTLKEGSTTLGTINLDNYGTGSFATDFALGNHQITAEYSGDSNLNPVVSDPLTQQVVELCSGQVVSLGDDNGQADTCGTLSYALLKASQQPTGADPFLIGFSTPVITLTTPLGVISNNNEVKINLNGGCQVSEGRGVPGVKIVKGVGAGATALTLGSNVTVNGFGITGFDGWAIEAQGSGNQINCNWIGTADGLTAGSDGGGIHLMGNNNILGLAGDVASGNLIGGNNQAGLLIEGASSGNQAYNNWFGLKSNGTGSLQNLVGNLVINTGGQLKLGQGNRLQR